MSTQSPKAVTLSKAFTRAVRRAHGTGGVMRYRPAHYAPRGVSFEDAMALALRLMNEAGTKA